MFDEGRGNHHLIDISSDLGLSFLVVGLETPAELNEAKVMVRLHGKKRSLSLKSETEENKKNDHAS